jgi:hypothetical protein
MAGTLSGDGVRPGAGRLSPAGRALPRDAGPDHEATRRRGPSLVAGSAMAVRSTTLPVAVPAKCDDSWLRVCRCRCCARVGYVCCYPRGVFFDTVDDAGLAF